MDKKSTFIGILLIGLAVGLMFFNAKNAPQPAPAPVATPAASTAIAPAQPAAVPAKPAPVPPKNRNVAKNVKIVYDHSKRKAASVRAEMAARGNAV